MNEHVSDMELERYLRRRDRLSQEYAALGSEGPPAELDARVLERARRALDEDARSPFWRRANWPRITALAATVMLSFALVVRLAIENEVPVTTAARPSVQGEAARATAGDATAPVPPADDVRYGGPEAASADRSEIDRRTDSAARVVPMAPPTAIQNAEMERTAPPAVPTREATSERYAPMPVSAEEPAQPPAGEESAAQTRGAGSAPLSDEARPMRREGALAKRAAESAQPQLATQERSASASVQPHASAAKAESSPSKAERDPQEWYEEIQRLRADGRTEEADRQMRELRAAHPDFEPAEAKADR